MIDCGLGNLTTLITIVLKHQKGHGSMAISIIRMDRIIHTHLLSLPLFKLVFHTKEPPSNKTRYVIDHDNRVGCVN